MIRAVDRLLRAGLALLWVGSACQAESPLLFTVYGDLSGGAHHVRVLAISEAGVIPGSAVVPEGNRALVLPGTIGVWVSEGKSVGLLLQLENEQGKVLGRGRTQGCVTAQAKDDDLKVQLQAAFTPWDSEFTARCNCGHAGAAGEMCPAQSTVPQSNKPTNMPDAALQAGPDAQATPDGGVIVTPPPDAGATSADAATPTPGPTDSDLFGFELAKDWTRAGGAVSLDTTLFTQGKASLVFTSTAAQPNAITSRPFATNELKNPTSTLSLDVFVAQAQDFSASVQMVLHCESVGIYEQYLTWHALQALPEGKWSSLRFVLSVDTAAKLKTAGAGCVLKLNHQGAGTFRFDNLVFVP